MRAVLVAALGLIVCAGGVEGAKLTPLPADPQGYFVADGTGYLNSGGPRYDIYGTKIEDNVGAHGEYDIGTYYSAGTDDLFVSASASVADPVYYPTQSIIGTTDGSIGASIVAETIIPDDGSGGPGAGGESSPGVGNQLTNSIRMAMYSTLRLQANPVTWQNNPAYPHGELDNESFSTDASFNATTNSADGFIYFRIDPVFNEQIGDPINLKLDHYREFNEYSNYGNGGYGGYMQVSNAFTINGNAVSHNGGTFSASVGDVVGIKLALGLHFNGGGQIAQPPFGLNQWIVAAGVDAFANATIDIPLTLGCSQQAPLMPDQIIGETNTYIFEDLSIGDEGVGIDTPAWIDPEIAIGYDLSVTGAGVTAIVLPDLLWAAGPCQVWYDDGAGPTWLTYYDEWDDAWYSDFFPGVTIDFPHAVHVFGITGIDPSLGLDPANPNAFPLGLIFDGPASGVAITMTPVAVPEPTTFAVLALGVTAVFRRRMGRV